MNRRYLPTTAVTFLALSTLHAQQPCQLTLVNEAGFNEASINLDIQYLGNQTQLSYLTGTIESTLNIDTGNNQSDQFTIGSADISASDISFHLSGWGQTVDLDSHNLKANSSTASPPGAVTPSTGSFDAAQHEFSVNGGDLSGTVNDDPLIVDLAAGPLNGAGTNNGSITLTHTGDTSTHAVFEVTVVFDIAVNQNVPTGFFIFGSEVRATVTISGTIKATGTCDVYFSPYLQWTDENNIPGSAFDASSLGKIPNGILWALGYDMNNQPAQMLVPTGGNFTIPLPASGTLSPAIIQCSTTLSGWAPVEPAKVSTGSSTIPAGSTGTITITPDGPSTFYRIKVVE